MSYTLIMSFILLAIIYIIYSFYSTIEKCRLSLKRIEIELNNIRKIKDGTEISMKNAEKELQEKWSVMNIKGIKEI